MLIKLHSVVIAGAARTVYLARVESDNVDKTWQGFTVFAAGIVELYLAIICACAPSLKYVFGRYFAYGGSRGSSARNGVLVHSSTSEGLGTDSRSTVREQGHEEMDSPMAKTMVGKETWYLDTETGS
jgi:hypothetical protein